MEKKLRYSHQREMIYEYIQSTKAHPSADMVYENLKDKIPKLSLGTVYRNLKLLEETGKIRRVTTVDNSERYDACCFNHAHFVCEKCGCVKDLCTLDAETEGKTYCVEPQDQIKWINVIFVGICADCSVKN